MLKSKVFACSGIVLWGIAFGLEVFGVGTPMAVGIPDTMAIFGILLILFFKIVGFILVSLGVIIFFIQKRKKNRSQKE